MKFLSYRLFKTFLEYRANTKLHFHIIFQGPKLIKVKLVTFKCA